MTNAPVKNMFSVLSVFAVAVAFSMGTFVVVAHADLGYVDTYGSNLGYVDTYGSNLGYVDTYGNYDLGYVDTYGSNLGYLDTYGSNLGYVDTYGTNLGYVDTYGSYPSYTPTYYTQPVSYVKPIAVVAPTYYAAPVGTSKSSATAISIAVVKPVGQSKSYHPVQQVYTVPTCNIYATSSSGSGQPVTLSWNSSNATSAFLTPGGGVAVNGSQTVYPTTTTTYTLAVHGSYGTSSNCQTTVYVSTTSATPSCTIYANPSTINYAGNSSTLTWSSSNATSANLSNVGSVGTSGSQTVNPSGTTTYTLTVTGAQGQSANCQTTVYVNTTSQAPSCWITLSPQSGYSGSYYNQQATLSWGSSNATSASINPNIGSVGTSGSRTVYPSVNQMYTMTVYNSQGQSATCQTSQYYQPMPTPTNLYCSISANPSSIQNGGTSYLTWTSYGASFAWLSDGLGNVGLSGSLTVRPESSRNYTMTVTDYQGRTQTCNTYVTVSGGYYPYVSLTQIPYTGFNLGPVGNTLYWLALALFALAAGYLLVYYIPGRRIQMPAFAAAARLPGFGPRTSAEGVSVPAIFTRKGTETASRRVVAPVAVSEKESSVSHSDAASKDAMTFARSEEGKAPRIVITRN